jgi:hypothetical protein
MTEWLQPLDAYILAPLKRFVRKADHSQQLSCPTGQVSTAQNMDMLCSAIHGVLNKEHWAFAFAKCGLSGQQELLGQRLREHLHWDTEPAPVSADLPSLAHLQAVWITGRHIPLGWLFSLSREVEPSPTMRRCHRPEKLMKRKQMTSQVGKVGFHMITLEDYAAPLVCSCTHKSLRQFPVLKHPARRAPRTEPLARRSHGSHRR